MYFFLDYTMIGFFVLCSVGWKVVKETRYKWPGTADLGLGGEKEEIDIYEAVYVEREEGRVGKFVNKLF